MAPGAGFRTSRRRRSPGAMMRLVAPLSWLAALLLGAAFWWADVLVGRRIDGSVAYHRRS